MGVLSSSTRTHPVAGNRCLHGRVVDTPVVLSEMLRVDLLAVEYARTWHRVALGAATREWAAPGFEVVVLGVFVALPVGFAAEGFGTVGEGAAVGAFVALFVFSMGGYNE